MIKRRTYLVIAFILSSFLLSSCSKNSDTYFPLEQGLRWGYDVRLETMDGVREQKYYYSSRGKQTLNDKNVYVKQSMQGNLLYYIEDETGLHHLASVDRNVSREGELQEFNNAERSIFQYPLEEGKQWQELSITRLLVKTGPPQKTEFKILAEIPVDVEIVSMNETVTVPAGTFNNVMKVTTSGSQYWNAGNYVGLTIVGIEETAWYAEGVGLVKFERKETTQKDALDKGSLLIELEEFSG